MNQTIQHPFAALLADAPTLPTIRDEDWRFTPLKAVTAQVWAEPSLHRLWRRRAILDGPGPSRKWYLALPVPTICEGVNSKKAVSRLEVLDGQLDDRCLRTRGGRTKLMLPHGVELVDQWAPMRLSNIARPFVDMNWRLARRGIHLRVARNTRVQDPIQIIYAGSDGASFARTLIELEDGAELAVHEHFTGTGKHFLGAITEAVIGANASLKVARVIADSAQAVHVGEFNARLARDARLVLDSIALEAEFARTELRVELAGEGSSCELRGLALAHGNSLFDHQIHVDHAKPHATSKQLFRNVLDDKSRGVFSGRVIVRPGANGTDATQQNNNLLLSDDARVDTKPMLEIYTDEVKCSHGATSGQLDANAVFFLRSRGLGVEQARNLLTFAFANEIIEHIAVPGVQQWLSARMGERFHGLGQ